MKRILALMLCVLLTLGTASCGFLSQKREQTATLPPEAETPSPSGYEGLIEEYRDLMLRRKNGEASPAPSAEVAEKLGAETASALARIAEKSEKPDEMGYAVKDINGDGVKELVLLTRGYILRMLFTLKNGAPALLLDYGFYYIDEDGGIFGSRTVEATEGKSKTYAYVMQRLEDGALVGLEYGVEEPADGTQAAYRLENGEKRAMSELEYRDLRARMDSVMKYSMEQNKIVGYRFLSAVFEEEPSTAPVADLSSYEGILSMYQRIVEMMVDHTREDWIRGEYDRTYLFRDEEAYAVFNAVFYACSTHYPRESYYTPYDYAAEGKQAFGYAVKDLNGDGVEELLLMTDHYEIMALFTKRNGSPVLLKRFDGGCYLGADGILRVEKYNTDLTEIEVFTYSVTDAGTLKNEVYLLWAPVHPGDRELGYGYFTVDGLGNRIRLSDEEGKRLYGLYAADMESVGSVSYTKLLSGLQFVRLYGEVTPAVRKYLYSSVSEHGVTVTAVEGECVTFSMDYFLYEDSPTPIYETVITATATRRDGVYAFDNGTVKGTLELCYDAIWVTVTESADENVKCNAYFFVAQKKK